MFSCLWSISVVAGQYFKNQQWQFPNGCTVICCGHLGYFGWRLWSVIEINMEKQKDYNFQSRIQFDNQANYLPRRSYILLWTLYGFLNQPQDFFALSTYIKIRGVSNRFHIQSLNTQCCETYPYFTQISGSQSTQCTTNLQRSCCSGTLYQFCSSASLDVDLVPVCSTISFSPALTSLILERSFFLFLLLQGL